MLVMPEWSRDELQSWWKLKLQDSLSADQFERLFEAYGGNIRHVLERPGFDPHFNDSSDYTASIKSAIYYTSVLDVGNVGFIQLF